MENSVNSYQTHFDQITKDPNYIRTIHRPYKGLISYALSLDPHSYPLPLRYKRYDKYSRQCCLYHNNKDIRRGYNNYFYLIIDLPRICEKAPSKFFDLPFDNTNYSYLPIARQYYDDDIDRILHYASRNIGVLDQLDDDLAEELEKYLTTKNNDQPSFFTRLLTSIHEYILEMYAWE